MTEEEKKAIETLEEIIKHKDDFDMAYGVKFLRPYSIGIEKQEQLEIALNLIKKLQKENEELKSNSIPKDKIRELLEEHNIEFAEDTIAMSEQGAFGFMLSIKELLEEE